MQFQIDMNFIGTIILPVLGLLLTVWIYFRQKTGKQISYRVVLTTSIPTFDKHVSELTNPDKQIIIQYTNAGNTALEPSDFHKGITTEFIDAKLLKAEIYRTFFSDKVYADISKSGSTSSFVPNLMNPYNSIYFSYDVRDFKNKIHVDTKIKNGKTVYNKPVRDILIGRLFLVASLYFGMVIANWRETKTIGLGMDSYYFFLLTTPLIGLSIIHTIKKFKEQFVFYFTWDVNSRY